MNLVGEEEGVSLRLFETRFVTSCLRFPAKNRARKNIIMTHGKQAVSFFDLFFGHLLLLKDYSSYRYTLNVYQGGVRER